VTPRTGLIHQVVSTVIPRTTAAIRALPPRKWGTPAIREIPAAGVEEGAEGVRNRRRLRAPYRSPTAACCKAAKRGPPARCSIPLPLRTARSDRTCQRDFSMECKSRPRFPATPIPSTGRRPSRSVTGNLTYKLENGQTVPGKIFISGPDPIPPQSIFQVPGAALPFVWVDAPGIDSPTYSGPGGMETLWSGKVTWNITSTLRDGSAWCIVKWSLTLTVNKGVPTWSFTP